MFNAFIQLNALPVVLAALGPTHAIVFDSGLPLLDDGLRNRPSTLDAIVSLHLGLLASHPDTLIARKAGDGAAQEVSARYALGALIGKKIWLQDVRLVRPLIVLDRPPGGKWNYQRIFASDTSPSSGPPAPSRSSSTQGSSVSCSGTSESRSTTTS